MQKNIGMVNNESYARLSLNVYLQCDERVYLDLDIIVLLCCYTFAADYS